MHKSCKYCEQSKQSEFNTHLGIWNAGSFGNVEWFDVKDVEIRLCMVCGGKELTPKGEKRIREVFDLVKSKTETA